MQKPSAEAGERRLHPRITAPERSLVAQSGDHAELPYNLHDISMGGMAFYYLNHRPLPLISAQMDIYLDRVLQIGLLPVTVVADQKLAEYSQLKRRCGVRFGELTREQRTQLRAFIDLQRG